MDKPDKLKRENPELHKMLSEIFQQEVKKSSNSKIQPQVQACSAFELEVDF